MVFIVLLLVAVICGSAMLLLDHNRFPATWTALGVVTALAVFVFVALLIAPPALRANASRCVCICAQHCDAHLQKNARISPCDK